jgi:hypothetical protein
MSRIDDAAAEITNSPVLCEPTGDELTALVAENDSAPYHKRRANDIKAIIAKHISAAELARELGKRFNAIVAKDKSGSFQYRFDDDALTAAIDQYLNGGE